MTKSTRFPALKSQAEIDRDDGYMAAFWRLCEAFNAWVDDSIGPGTTANRIGCCLSVAAMIGGFIAFQIATWGL